jgi:hypothetical protein
LALHSHGSALLSVHPKVPAADNRSVIAACASSVEQAAGGVGFADWERIKTTAHAGHSFPQEGSRLIAKNGSTSSAATAASGRHQPLKREVRHGGFGEFTQHASPTQAQSEA